MNIGSGNNSRGTVKKFRNQLGSNYILIMPSIQIVVYRITCGPGVQSVIYSIQLRVAVIVITSIPDEFYR